RPVARVPRGGAAAGGEPPETDDGGGRVPLWRDDAAGRVVAGDQRAGDRRVVVTAPMRGHGWPPFWRNDVRSAEPSRLCRSAEPTFAEVLDGPERIIKSAPA